MYLAQKIVKDQKANILGFVGAPIQSLLQLLNSALAVCKELAYAIVGASKSEICRASQQAGNSRN